MTEPILPPLKPIPMKDRFSVLFVDRGQLDVLDGAFVRVDKKGVRTLRAAVAGAGVSIQIN
jgi:CRISPR-associated protein Cas1